MIDVKETLALAEEKMEEAVMYLDDSLARIRAGKANIKILDGIRVENYGSMVPLNNVAAVNTPDARTIAIKPWDKTMFKVIEKAIIDSEVGIMPDNNGEIIRLNIPPLTEERRKQLVKQCGKEEEQAKISVRNARRDILEKLKKGVKDGLAEDAEKDAEDKLQKMHDKYIKQIEALMAANPKLDALIPAGGGGDPLQGAIAAVERAGKTGKIHIVSTDFLPDLGKRLENGSMAGESGGHYCDPLFAFMMTYNAIKGNYKDFAGKFVDFKFPYLYVSSPKDYSGYEEYFVKQLPYTDKELVDMSKLDMNALQATASKLSIEDAKARSGK